MNILAQRIAASDWQNVAKITGMSPARAEKQFGLIAAPADPIKTVLTERAQKAGAVAVARDRRRQENVTNSNARRKARRTRAFVKNKPWFDLIEARMWRLGWDKADLAEVLGMEPRKVRRFFCEQGDFSIADRNLIIAMLCRGEALALEDTTRGFDGQTGAADE